MSTVLVQRSRYTYIYSVLVLDGPGATIRKQEPYHHHPVKRKATRSQRYITRVQCSLRQHVYEDKSGSQVTNHTLGTILPGLHTFRSILTAALENSSPLISTFYVKKLRHGKVLGLPRSQWQLRRQAGWFQSPGLFISDAMESMCSLKLDLRYRGGSF